MVQKWNGGHREGLCHFGEMTGSRWPRGVGMLPGLYCHLAGPQLSRQACPWLGYSFPPQNLTAVLFCFLVPNRCKKVCSHLCLLRPGGYSCACPQGSSFVEGSITECNAGRDTAQPATGSWESCSAFFSRCPTHASSSSGA